MATSTPLDALSLLGDDAVAQTAGAAAASAAAADSSSAAAPAPAAVARPSAVVEKSGWMLINSDIGAPSEFHRYWFSLADNQLSYFDSEEATEPLGSIQLEGCSCDITPESKYNMSACFELNSPVQSRLYALGCENQGEMQGWINSIRKVRRQLEHSRARHGQRGSCARLLIGVSLDALCSCHDIVADISLLLVQTLLLVLFSAC